MADNFAVCLIGAMDRLWFHHILLFSSQPSSKTLRKPSSAEESLPTPEPLLPSPSFQEEEELSTVEFPILDLHQDSSKASFITDDDSGNQEEERETCKLCNRPTSLDRNRSHLYSPSKQSRRNRRWHSDSVWSMKVKLQKSMSCRDLELEELKGFMDLGFIFKEEHLNKRMMSVVPGLQRLGLSRNRDQDGDGEETKEEENRGAMRPYLSEAWLIRRANSPLLNLRLPRVYAAADMKKHLTSWARTVASVVQQECWQAAQQVLFSNKFE